MGSELSETHLVLGQGLQGPPTRPGIVPLAAGLWEGLGGPGRTQTAEVRGISILPLSSRLFGVLCTVALTF